MKKISVDLFLFLSLLSLTAGCAGMQPRYHRVESGDTLAKIASQYHCSVGELQRYNHSLLQTTGFRTGIRLYVPIEENGYQEDASYQEGAKPPSVARQDASLEEFSAAHFTWPVSGYVTSPFGKRGKKDHDGVDIGAKQGTIVRAARSGHVIYAGNRIRGYGNMIIIRHADTFSTVYAHLSKITVKKNQFIGRGLPIGRVGHTGHATGSHLHFEVRNNRVPVDPLLYLQGQFAANKISSR
jgi:murein DD-endopeptidase MepM/ murein hydrolase activator NlpD